MTRKLKFTKGRLMVFTIACFLCFINLTSAFSPHIDSLKMLAQTAPFPERLDHLITWYTETNELFHEPEIAMMKAGVNWLEALPQMNRKQLLKWSNLQLMLASMYSDNERLEDLFNAAMSVIVMADSLGNKEEKWIMQKGQAYFYLSMVAYLEQKDDVKLQQLEKAFQCFEEIDHKPLMAQALGSIGVAQSGLGQHQKAFETCGRSAALYQQEGNEYGYLRSSFYQAVELILMEKLNDAETKLNELVPRLRKTNHVSLNIALTNLGDVQAQLGKYEAAETNLTEALAMAKKRRVNYTVAETYQFLANMEEKRGEYEKALFYQREQARYADSIRIQAQEKGLKEAQAKFDQTENKLKIKELEEKIAAERWASRVKMFYLAAALFVLGSVIFWYFHKKKKKEIKEAARTVTIYFQPLESDPAEKVDPFVQEFIGIVQEQIDDDKLTVERIAQSLRMSRVQLFKKVKNATGTSPSEIIRQFRLEVGKRLLSENTLTVSEVAYRVGFGNPNSFSRAFKDKFGSSPSEYIKNSK